MSKRIYKRNIKIQQNEKLNKRCYASSSLSLVSSSASLAKMLGATLEGWCMSGIHNPLNVDESLIHALHLLFQEIKALKNMPKISMDILDQT